MSANGAAPDMSESKPVSPIKIGLRKFIKSVRSPLGLTLVLFIYTALGAAVFKVLEGRAELDTKIPIIRVQKEVVDALWATPIAVKKNEHAFRLLARRELIKYEKKLLEAFQGGITSDTASKTWDFWGSFYHCITIITTIGYGNFAAVTDGGRVFTMVYALFGIPLCLIVMNELGKLLTKVIKYIHYILICIIHLLKVIVIKVKNYKKEETEKQTLEMPACNADEDFDFTLLTAILVGILYMILGVVMYQQAEDWSSLEAFYFIFISLSTIGFGDVLPGDTQFFMATSVYILGGLAVIGSVIGIIQDAMDAKVASAKVKLEDIGKTIGLDIAADVDEVTEEDKNK